jgi:hypothetical protein
MPGMDMDAKEKKFAKVFNF